MKKNIITFIVIIINIIFTTLLTSVLAAEIDLDEEYFYLDAIAFKSNKIDTAQIDIFAVIPYKNLNFINSNNKYNAKYTLLITITDLNNISVFSKTYNKTIQVDDYSKSLGTNSEFSKIQDRYYLTEGSYKIRAIFTDYFSKTEYEKQRNITIVNFNKYPFSLSGILLLSNIEEKENGQYLITPHLSDNISSIQDDFFAFFEVYNNLDNCDKIQIVSEILNTEKDTTLYFNHKEQEITQGTNQIYTRFPYNNILFSNRNNILRITVKKTDSQNILVATQRSIKNQSYYITKIKTNLTTAIKQLRYVATDKEIDTILSETDEIKQLKLFENFWRRIDPTPNTNRNEALEEYYSRIEYANKNFKSYAEGWLTDKGHLFIVFGPPDLVERTNASYSDLKTYEKWTYNNNIFLFYDISGFGDFRLSNPAFVNEKYRYK